VRKKLDNLMTPSPQQDKAPLWEAYSPGLTSFAGPDELLE
jgi:hypothetical protein